jgi:hypothetical protein
MIQCLAAQARVIMDRPSWIYQFILPYSYRLPRMTSRPRFVINWPCRCHPNLSIQRGKQQSALIPVFNDFGTMFLPLNMDNWTRPFPLLRFWSCDLWWIAMPQMMSHSWDETISKPIGPTKSCPTVISGAIYGQSALVPATVNSIIH